MKQRITKEQLLSLSDDKKEKLRDIWEPREYDTILVCEEDDCREEVIIGLIKEFPDSPIQYSEFCDTIGKNDCLPLLSIGQMMEILDITSGFTIKKVKDNYEIFFVVKKVNDVFRSGIIFYDEELCNALWEAVKEVL